MVEIPRQLSEAEWDRIISAKEATDAAALRTAQSVVPEQAAPASLHDELDWPPGGAGHLAQLIFAMSIRPVKEVAITSAISILAGVCGLNWNTHTGAGLNLYIAFVARSAVGKEAIAEAPGKLTDAALEAKGRYATNFFVYDDFASCQALVTGLKGASSILQIAGEFGHTIGMMASDKSGPFATLRRQMTRLYPKSGKHSKAGGMAYANEEKNTTLDGAVSYSVVGDTTPGTFFEALRLRTHSQNNTMAARAQADRKMSARLSKRMAILRQSFRRPNMFSIL